VGENGLVLFKDETSFSFEDSQGDILFSMKNMGVLDLLKKKQIEYVHMASAYNLQERVCEPEMVGYCHSLGLDVVSKVKSTPKPIDQNEKSLYLVSSNIQRILIRQADQID
jgi:hypothetical protein